MVSYELVARWCGHCRGVFTCQCGRYQALSRVDVDIAEVLSGVDVCVVKALSCVGVDIAEVLSDVDVCVVKALSRVEVDIAWVLSAVDAVVAKAL